MNPRTFLAVSLVVNAALGLLLIAQLRRPPPPLNPPGAHASHPAPAASPQPGRNPPVAPAVLVRTNQVASKFDWRRVESTDYKEYIANLRSIGCPEETIRDIIVADVNKLFDARRKTARDQSTNRFEFWKPGNPFAGLFNEEDMTARQQVAQEKRALLKELLGVDVPDKSEAFGAAQMFETVLDFLPAEKQSALMEIQQKYAGRMMKAAKDMQEDPKGVQAVQKELDAEMAQLLGPKDKIEYDLRLSQTAIMMRMQMGEFEPTEDEFRKMFAARKKFDDEFGLMNVSRKPEEIAARKAAETAMKSEVKAILGEQRSREYQQDQDWTQSSLRGVAREFNVPRDQAIKVLDMRETAQQAADKIRSNSSLAPADRKEALEAIGRETEAAVNATLGADAGKAYKERGSWLRDLTRDATPPRPRPTN